jgi:predicted GNAT family acetyltransferase
MPISATGHDRADEVLALAGDFLEGKPVEHNLVLTLLKARVQQPEPGRYWIVRDGNDPVGLALWSPFTQPVVVTPMPLDAARTLVEAMVAEDARVPGVNGEAAVAAAFAGHWAERAKVAAHPVMGLRYQLLGHLTPPSGVPGASREATAADVDVVTAYLQGFADFSDQPNLSPDAIGRAIARKAYTLWEVDGRPVCLVGHALPVAGVTRIAPVYTPPEERRRGYAGAGTAAVSARIVADGQRCVLYTDLGNPISNSVYRSLGFATVAEVLRYAFDDPRTNSLP